MSEVCWRYNIVFIGYGHFKRAFRNRPFLYFPVRFTLRKNITFKCKTFIPRFQNINWSNSNSFKQWRVNHYRVRGTRSPSVHHFYGFKNAKSDVLGSGSRQWCRLIIQRAYNHVSRGGKAGRRYIILWRRKKWIYLKRTPGRPTSSPESSTFILKFKLKYLIFSIIFTTVIVKRIYFFRRKISIKVFTFISS